MSRTMKLESIKFVEYDRDGNGIFVNNASCFEEWPKEIEMHDKLYTFKSLGFMQSWMVGEYSGVAEYEVTVQDTRPIDKYSKEKELALIACKYLDVKTLEVRERDSLDFHDIHVKNIKNTLDKTLDIGFFIGIVSSCRMSVKKEQDGTVSLRYTGIDQREKHLKTYQNLEEIKRDSVKFNFNFGF